MRSPAQPTSDEGGKNNNKIKDQTWTTHAGVGRQSRSLCCTYELIFDSDKREKERERNGKDELVSSIPSVCLSVCTDRFKLPTNSA